MSEAKTYQVQLEITRTETVDITAPDASRARDKANYSRIRGRGRRRDHLLGRQRRLRAVAMTSITNGQLKSRLSRFGSLMFPL